MARAEYGRIGAYVTQLQPDLFGSLRTRRRIAEEVRGHLEDAAERHEQGGLSPDQAERRAVEDFGSQDAVINSWAESKGIGMATNFTRFGGLAGIVGAVALMGAMTYAEASEAFSQGWFAEIALAGTALMGVALIAVYMRLRGKLVRFGRLGFRLLIGGVPVTLVSSSLWFAPGAIAGIVAFVVGLALMIIGAVRAQVLPIGPFLLWAGGFVAGMGVGLVGTVADVDTGPVSGVIAFTSVAVGWIWLGAHLWSEKVSLQEPHTSATV